MAGLEPTTIYSQDTKVLRLAREIAIDLHDIETILKNNEITLKEWERLQKDPRFLKLLESEILAWNAAGNTHERTKLKASALVEEWLVEANRLLYGSDTLTAKTELAKLVTRIAGMGLERANVEGVSAEKFSVTINLGANNKLSFEKDATVTSKVIEGQVLPSPEV